MFQLALLRDTCVTGELTESVTLMYVGGSSLPSSLAFFIASISQTLRVVPPSWAQTSTHVASLTMVPSAFLSILLTRGPEQYILELWASVSAMTCWISGWISPLGVRKGIVLVEIVPRRPMLPVEDAMEFEAECEPESAWAAWARRLISFEGAPEPVRADCVEACGRSLAIMMLLARPCSSQFPASGRWWPV